MQRKILFLINPIAGTGKKKHLEDLIQAKTTEKEIPFAIWSTPGDGSYDPIVEHVQSMKYTDICICGGDGTVNAVVHALAHLPVCFSIIPSGSGNGLAYTAGIPKNPRKALEVLFEGVPTETDAFLINDSFACMLAGCGLDAHVAAAFANSSSRGFLTYTRLTMKALIKSSAYAFELTVKNRTWELDAMMITVSNSNQFGNQFTIAPRASLNDGLLDVVIIKKMPVLRFIVSATRQLLIGKPSEMEWNSKSEVIYFQTNQLKVVNKNHAPFHIDGDPQPTPSEMNIRVLPKHFRLIHGKPRRYPTVDK